MQASIKKFLDEVCIHIRWKAAHSEVRRELAAHLEDLTQSYLEQGKREEEAAELAVLAMGSGEDIGLGLNQQHRPQTDWSLILAVALLVGFGVALLVCGQINGFGGNSHGVRHLVGVAAGLAVSGGLMYLDYTKILKYSGMLYVCILLILLVGSVVDTTVFGARVWVIGFGTTIMAGHLFVLALIPLVGFLYRYKGGGWFELCKWLGLCGLTALIGLNYTVISYVCLFLLCAGVLLLAAILSGHFRGKRGHYIAGLIPSAVVLLGIGWLQIAPHITMRLQGWKDPLVNGYAAHVAKQMQVAAPLFGKASQTGTLDGRWIVAGDSDFAFTSIVGSLGWVAGIALLLVIAFFLVRMVRLAANVRQEYGRWLAVTACIVLAVKFLINILMNFGLIPTIGIALPLISKGGTDFMINMIFIGLTLSVWRRDRLPSKEEENMAMAGKETSFFTYEDGKLIFNVAALWRKRQKEVLAEDRK